MKTRLILVVVVLLFAKALCQQCWYPDGMTQSQDKPCNASAAASSCCNEDDMCLDNGLCLHFGIISRGSCTDKTWTSDSCPRYCTDQPSGGVTLMPCNAWGRVFSCTWGNCSKEDLFSVNGGSAIMLRDHQVASLGLPAAITVGATDVLRSVASTNSAGCASNGNSTTNTTEASSIGDSTSAQYTAGDMAAMGAGIGIPLALALAGIIFLLARQRRRPDGQLQTKYPFSQVLQPAAQTAALDEGTHMLYCGQLQKKDGQTTRYELGHAPIGEMEAYAARQELSALGPQ